MRLVNRLVASLRQSSAYADSSDLIAQGRDVSLAVPGLVRPLLAAALYTEHPRPMLVAIAGEQAAERFARQLTSYLEPGRVLHFAERREPPWSDTPPDLETVGARARALHALSSGREVIVVASARALLRALPPHGSHVFEPLVLEVGAAARPRRDASRGSPAWATSASSRPRSAGSSRCVAACSTCSPSDATIPVRAELFGDEIETLRRYVPSTGQSIGDAGRDRDLPVPRESQLSTTSGRSRAARTLRERALKEPEIAHHLELMRAGHLLQRHRALPAAALRDPGRAHRLPVARDARSWSPSRARCSTTPCGATTSSPQAARRRRRLARRSRGARRPGSIWAAVSASRCCRCCAPVVRSTPSSPRGAPRSPVARKRSSRGVRALTEIGYAVVARGARSTCPSASRRHACRRGSVHRRGAGARAPLGDHRHAPRRLCRLLLRGGVTHLAPLDVPAGFVIPEARLAVVSIDDVYPALGSCAPRGRDDRSHAHDVRVRARRLRRPRHARHRAVQRDGAQGGPGRRARLPACSSTRRATGSTCRSSRSTASASTSAPRAARRGSRASTPRTGRARPARRARPPASSRSTWSICTRAAPLSRGTRSAPTPPWQIEMEAAFPFEETPDQLAAIADVKADMESDKPMDRLDLRRRRLRQDRGRDPRGVQGGAGRQAGHGAVPDHDSRAAALHDVLGALRAVRRARRGPVALPDAGAAAARRSRASRRATVDVLIGTHRLLSRDVDSAATWGSWSSTRSSASASSTRSTSRTCASRSTSSRSRRRRSRARCRCRCRACAT